MSRIPWMSKAKGARLILDANLNNPASTYVVKVCPVCGARLTLKPESAIVRHFTPGEHSHTVCAGAIVVEETPLGEQIDGE